ncbi:MAG TPA: lysophospholipid acyltransferase family protein [Chthonomonadaceae bacterium]|nr:lysophospholipid acyltransferase family protein [Chthonomonadaceae bacterium]
MLRVIGWMTLWPIYAILGRFRVEGRENVPRTGGVLITPNHISYGDPPAVVMAATPRYVYLMAWAALFKVPVLRTLIRWMRAIPIEPGTPDRAALKRAEALLKAGEAVVIFPEGGVSESGVLQPILPGALLLAQRTGVPILPTILIHTNLMLPYEKVIPRFSKKQIVCRFGKPVTLEELTGGGKGSEALRRGADRLRELLLALQQNQPYPEATPQEESHAHS